MTRRKRFAMCVRTARHDGGWLLGLMRRHRRAGAVLQGQRQGGSRWRAWIYAVFGCSAAFWIHGCAAGDGGDPAQPEAATTARVVNVLSGDTLVVRIGAAKAHVQILGVSAPTSVGGDGRSDCYAREARKALVELAPVDTDVTILADRTRRGSQKRAALTGDVRASGVWVGRRLVRQGAARATSQRYADDEGVARDRNRGMWGACSRHRIMRVAGSRVGSAAPSAHTKLNPSPAAGLTLAVLAALWWRRHNTRWRPFRRAEVERIALAVTIDLFGGQRSVILVTRRYQLAAEGTKCMVRTQSGEVRDAWFWHARPRGRRAYVVLANDGYGPHKAHQILYVGTNGHSGICYAVPPRVWRQLARQ